MTLAEKYSIDFPEGTNAATIELAMAFRRELMAAPGHLGCYQHLKNAIELIWNEPNRQKRQACGQPYDPRKHDVFIWQDWSEQQLQALCERRWSTSFISGNSCGKTTSAAIYALCAFYASPFNTSVVMTTTTLPGLRRRVWKEVMHFHSKSRTGIGIPHATDYAIRFEKGSDKNGIFGVATGQTEGEVEKAVNKIIGYHNTNVIAMIDEAQATNDAITKAGVSLEAGTNTFQMILLGNIDSELSALGQACEPVAEGWPSVTVESGRWETRRGICLHFDCYACPRVIEGSQYYPGLVTADDIESAKKEYGEDSPWFWQFRRGFPPPQGVLKTVLSAPELARGRAMEQPVWQDKFERGISLDPAYGDGDRCVLQLWHCGLLDDGRTAMALIETKLIKLEASSREPIHYQIARQTREWGEEHKVKPDMCAVDSTAEGGGIASILRETWDNGILGVEFGGAASQDRLSESNPKKASELYDRRVTELYMRFRELVKNGQIRGLDRATANEFCLREYDTKAYGITAVETKMEMKKRTHGRSCDLSDAACIGAELFRKRGLLLSPVDMVPRRSTSWLDWAKDYNDVESNYMETAS